MELEIRQITHIYKNGKKALDQVSMTLTPGVYGLLGPNGAGKSTLMNIITDNLLPTEGDVLLDGKGISADSVSYRDRLGYMPQQQSLYSQFTGIRFLWYMAALKGIPRKKAGERIGRLLELVNLEEASGRRIGAYSGGMKQRLLIAQALLNDPDVLVLDEPTAGLDPKERIRIRNFVSEIAQDKIVLLATHVVSDVECIAKEIILLKQGSVTRDGKPVELIHELDGLVWEFPVEPSDVSRVQKQYLISSLSVRENGLIAKAVGRPEELPEQKTKAQPGLEEVYLYQMESDQR